MLKYMSELLIFGGILVSIIFVIIVIIVFNKKKSSKKPKKPKKQFEPPKFKNRLYASDGTRYDIYDDNSVRIYSSPTSILQL